MPDRPDIPTGPSISDDPDDPMAASDSRALLLAIGEGAPAADADTAWVGLRARLRRRRRARGAVAAIAAFGTAALAIGVLATRDDDLNATPIATDQVDEHGLVPVTVDLDRLLEPIADLPRCDDTDEFQGWARTRRDEMFAVMFDDFAPAETPPLSTIQRVATDTPVYVPRDDRSERLHPACLTAVWNDTGLHAWEMRDTEGDLLARGISDLWPSRNGPPDVPPPDLGFAPSMASGHHVPFSSEIDWSNGVALAIRLESVNYGRRTSIEIGRPPDPSGLAFSEYERRPISLREDYRTDDEVRADRLQTILTIERLVRTSNDNHVLDRTRQSTVPGPGPGQRVLSARLPARIPNGYTLCTGHAIDRTTPPPPEPDETSLYWGATGYCAPVRSSILVGWTTAGGLRDTHTTAFDAGRTATLGVVTNGRRALFVGVKPDQGLRIETADPSVDDEMLIAIARTVEAAVAPRIPVRVDFSGEPPEPRDYVAIIHALGGTNLSSEKEWSGQWRPPPPTSSGGQEGFEYDGRVFSLAWETPDADRMRDGVFIYPGLDQQEIVDGTSHRVDVLGRRDDEDDDRGGVGTPVAVWAYCRGREIQLHRNVRTASEQGGDAALLPLMSGVLRSLGC